MLQNDRLCFERVDVPLVKGQQLGLLPALWQSVACGDLRGFVLVYRYEFSREDCQQVQALEERGDNYSSRELTVSPATHLHGGKRKVTARGDAINIIERKLKLTGLVVAAAVTACMCADE